jgi:hypothetical protein
VLGITAWCSPRRGRGYPFLSHQKRTTACARPDPLQVGIPGGGCPGLHQPATRSTA